MYNPRFTGVHSSPKERQLQKCCVSFGKECSSGENDTMCDVDKKCVSGNPAVIKTSYVFGMSGEDDVNGGMLIEGRGAVEAEMGKGRKGKSLTKVEIIRAIGYIQSIDKIETAENTGITHKY